MEDSVKIEIRIQENIATLALGGRLTTITSPEVQAKVDGLPKEIRSVDFNLRELEYISSAGLRVLAAADELFAGRGGRIRLLNVNASVREVLEITGFTDIFELA